MMPISNFSCICGSYHFLCSQRAYRLQQLYQSTFLRWTRDKYTRVKVRDVYTNLWLKSCSNLYTYVQFRLVFYHTCPSCMCLVTLQILNGNITRCLSIYKNQRRHLGGAKQRADKVPLIESKTQLLSLTNILRSKLLECADYSINLPINQFVRIRPIHLEDCTYLTYYRTSCCDPKLTTHPPFPGFYCSKT